MKLLTKLLIKLLLKLLIELLIKLLVKEHFEFQKQARKDSKGASAISYQGLGLSF